MSTGNVELLMRVSSILCLIGASYGFVPLDYYLLDCGSSTNSSVGDRVFVGDDYNSNTLSTPRNISAKTTLRPISSSYDSALYQTARILDETSSYTFPIKKRGRHWIRLYFFPFVYQNYNLRMAKFSVSAQNVTFLKDFQVLNDSQVREYSLNVTSSNLVLTFTPSSKSFAFINALEFLSLPDELTPESVRTIDPQGSHQSLSNKALETVVRVNMGNETVPPQNDTLWRLWVSDDRYLMHNNLAKFLKNTKAVNSTRGKAMENIAPLTVYGTATKLNSDDDPNLNANVTWRFDVDPGFEYLVRFHFCDIVSSPIHALFFNVYINSMLVSRNLDLGHLTSNIIGAPYFMDVITRKSDSSKLNVSVGPSDVGNPWPDAILNGLEILKISNSKGSLAVMDSDLRKSSKMKLGVIVGLALGMFTAVILAMGLFLLCRRRRRRRYTHVSHSKVEENFATAELESKYSNNGTAIFSSSKIGYRFPFVAIQEATDNFSESLVIGAGGFGKVYKGILRDKTEVAVKRGFSHSKQGFAEFRTEIEMLSLFRHRHLVSLIGYCDEQNEMIILYEYMENGTIKNHLYGSNLPSLSWRQRLEICIGSARGLHYLHTSSAKAIIHRDVKSANILLDENLMAKVADFGLSKCGPEIDKTHVSTAVKGSFGYLDPEYLTRQQLTEKSDVYSFGVVMLEVLCGRPVIDPSLPREEVNLVEWALNSQKRGQMEEIVDSRIAGQIKPESLRKFGEIAEKCLAEHGVHRPTMGDVLWNLECALRLQEIGRRSDPNGAQSSQINPVNNLETSVSTAQFSMGSVCELDGVSMSKVFAQMVREDMR